MSTFHAFSWLKYHSCWISNITIDSLSTTQLSYLYCMVCLRKPNFLRFVFLHHCASQSRYTACTFVKHHSPDGAYANNFPALVSSHSEVARGSLPCKLPGSLVVSGVSEQVLLPTCLCSKIDPYIYCFFTNQTRYKLLFSPLTHLTIQQYNQELKFRNHLTSLNSGPFVDSRQCRRKSIKTYTTLGKTLNLLSILI